MSGSDCRSFFVNERTFEIMADPESMKLQALIDIDRDIAMGLSSTTPGPNG